MLLKNQQVKLKILQLNMKVYRLSKEDIDRMVNEAEQFKEADEKVRARVESRGKLENYIFT